MAEPPSRSRRLGLLALSVLALVLAIVVSRHRPAELPAPRPAPKPELALPPTGRGPLIYRISSAGRALPGAKALLIADDEARSARAPPCGCPPTTPPAPGDTAGEPAAGEPLTVLDRQCAPCSAKLELLTDLAVHGSDLHPGIEGTAGADGILRFDDLPRITSYDLWVEAPGLGPEILLDQAPQLPPLPDAGVSLEPEEIALETSGTAQVKVEDAASTAIPGAHLAAFVDRPFRTLAIAPSGDHFAAPSISPERVTYFAWSEGYLPRLVRGTELDSDPASIAEIVLSLPHTVRGVVRHGAERIGGAEVTLTQKETDQESHLTADDQGNFSVTNAPGGPYHLSAQRGALHGELAVQIPQFGDVPDLELQVVGQARLEGDVVDAQTGKRVDGAIVTLQTDRDEEDLDHFLGTAITDGGAFVISGLDPGFFQVEVSALDHVAGKADVELLEGEALHLKLSLEPGFRLVGQILGADDRPVPDAKVRISQPGATGETLSRDGGTFLSHLAEGSAELMVGAEGYESWVQSVAVPDDGRVVHLSRGASIQGHVDGPDGPVAMASVTLSSEGTRGPAGSFWTDEHGNFEATGLTPGRGKIAAQAEGLAPSRPMELVASREPAPPISIHLERGLSISGTVVDDQGRPLEGAQLAASFLSAHNPAGDFSSVNVTSARDGAFTISGLPPGNLQLTCFLESYTQGDELRAAAGSTGVRVQLHRRSGVRGRVVDSRGSALHQFLVNGELVNSRDGSFQIDPVDGSSFVISGDFMARTVEAAVKPGEIADLGTIEVNEGLSISGEVRSPEGQPAPTSTVTCVLASGAVDDADESGQRIVQADAFGNFTFHHLRKGRYRLIAECPLGVSDPVEADADTSGVDIQLSTSGRLSGTLSYADGYPVVRGLVDAAVGPITRSTEVTGGHFEIAGLPQGVAHVVGVSLAGGQNHSWAVTDVQVAPGRTVTVQLTVGDPRP